MIFLLVFAVAPFVEEPLPRGAVARLGSARWRNGDSYSAIGFSPDGAVIAVAGHRGLALYETAGGSPLRTLGDSPAGTFGFAPGGRSLMVGDSRSIRLFDVASGRMLRRFEDGWMAALGHDGRWAAWSDVAGEVTIVDMTTGERRRSFGRADNFINALVTHPTRADVATIDGSGTLRVYDALTGASRWEATAHTRSPRVPRRHALAYSPGGLTLASGGDTLRLWRASDGRPLGVLARGGPACDAVAFGRSRIAAAFADGTVRVYDGGHETRRWAVPAFKLAFAPNGRMLAVCGYSGVIRLFDAVTGKEPYPAGGHAGDIWHVRSLPTGRLLSVDETGRALTWDVAARTAAVLPPLGRGPIDVSPDGRLVTAGGAVRDLRTGAVVCRIDVPAGHAPLRFSPDGRQVAVRAADGSFTRFDAARGVRLGSISVRGQGFGVSRAVPWSPDGRFLLTVDADDGVRDEVCLVNAADGAEIWRKPGNAAAFGPDGRLVAVVQSGRTVTLLDAESGATVRSWAHGQGHVPEVRFSPCGRMLVTTSFFDRPGVRVWETATGQVLRDFAGHAGIQRVAGFSPDGRVVATGGSDTNVLLWDLTRRLKGGKLTPARTDLADRWHRLASNNAEDAHAALWEFVSTPVESAAFLAARLRPQLPLGGRLRRLLEDLDSEVVGVRQAAEAELLRHGPGAGPELRAGLAVQPLEPRRRIERLLKRWRESPEALREGRAVMALEQVGEAARPLLKRLAAGAKGADLTEAARRALAQGLR